MQRSWGENKNVNCSFNQKDVSGAELSEIQIWGLFFFFFFKLL